MFYLTFRFHDNSVNTLGFIERVGGGGAFKALLPPSPGTLKKPRQNRVKHFLNVEKASYWLLESLRHSRVLARETGLKF